MSEFEQEVKKAEQELEQGLVPVNTGQQAGGSFLDDEFLGDLKVQAQEYGQKIQDAAVKARDYAGERFKDLQGKDAKELVEDAKEFARQKPGQALAISAIVGLVVGLIIKRK
jgi:ElaB/YqjD/DUF883 family membrane-anchored ribosome-binding protein